MVTEAKEKPQTQDIPLETGPSSEKVAPKTRTEAEYLKAVSDEKTISGRLKTQLETVTKEAEQAKKDAQEATSTLEETRKQISDLESDIDVLEESEADPNKLSRLRKELRDAKGKVSQEVKGERDAIDELKKALEAERLEWAGTVVEAQAFKFDSDLAKVVDEYDGDVTANFTRLKTACDKAGIKTKEGAEAIAETFLTKKTEEPDLLNDTGVTSGGSEDLNNLSSRELLARAYKTKKR